MARSKANGTARVSKAKKGTGRTVTRTRNNPVPMRAMNAADSNSREQGTGRPTRKIGPRPRR